MKIPTKKTFIGFQWAKFTQFWSHKLYDHGHVFKFFGTVRFFQNFFLPNFQLHLNWEPTWAAPDLIVLLMNSYKILIGASTTKNWINLLEVPSNHSNDFWFLYNPNLEAPISDLFRTNTVKQTEVYYSQILRRKIWDKNPTILRPETRSKWRFLVSQGRFTDFGTPFNTAKGVQKSYYGHRYLLL